MTTISTIPTIDVLPNTGNWDFIQLLDDENPANLATVDRIVLILDDCITIDSAVTGGIIAWDTTKIGVVGLRLGKYTAWPSDIRVYYAKLMVFDPISPKGILFGTIRIRLLSECTP